MSRAIPKTINYFSIRRLPGSSGARCVSLHGNNVTLCCEKAIDLYDTVEHSNTSLQLIQIIENIESVESLSIRNMVSLRTMLALAEKTRQISVFTELPPNIIEPIADKIVEILVCSDSRPLFDIPGMCDKLIWVTGDSCEVRTLLRMLPEECTNLHIELLPGNDAEWIGDSFWEEIAKFTQLRELKVRGRPVESEPKIPETLEYLEIQGGGQLVHILENSYLRKLVVWTNTSHPVEVSLDVFEQNNYLFEARGFSIIGDDGHRQRDAILNRNKFAFRSARTRPIMQ